MLASVLSSAIAGVDAFPVEVEVDTGGGAPSFRMVGLAEGAVREAFERMKSAIRNSGYDFPHGKITINLAPADVRKEGPSFDLPIALGMLAASEQIETDQLDNFVIVGELALTGAVAPVGFLPVLQN